MRKNKISKLALLTGLLIINTNTKGFYQCVPKEDWLIYFVRKHQGTEWVKVLDLQISSPLDKFKGYLEPGRYRVKAAGAGGKEEKRSFYLRQKAEFKACVGAGGGNGMNYSTSNWPGGGGGGGGRGYSGYYCGGTGGGGGINTGGCASCGGRGCNGGNSGMSGFITFSSVGTGYGVGYGGEHGGIQGLSHRGYGGYGCYGGGGGSSGDNNGLGGGGGGGGGSYFKVGDIELILKGADGSYGWEGGSGAGFDGYVILEKLE